MRSIISSEVTAENRKASYKSDGNVSAGLSGLVILCLVCKTRTQPICRDENLPHSSRLFSCLGSKRDRSDRGQLNVLVLGDLE
jgi:hypothetical protein